MIHCLGDSHSSFFSGNEEMQPIWPQKSNDITPFFKSYRLGPCTAYQLLNKIDIIKDILNIKVNKDEDYVLFCFGEVDVRAHLLKQSNEQNRNIDDIILECVTRYFEVMKIINSLGFRVIVWGVIATWSDLKPYTGPSFGTQIERNSITYKFNSFLEKFSKENDFIFVSMYDEMLNEDGTTIHEYLDDWEGCHIHLNQKIMPQTLEKFKNLKLI